MNFFSKLFGKNKKLFPDSSVGLTTEQMMQTKYIQTLLQKYRKKATLLRPHKSMVPLSYDKSKFGGVPNFNGFNSYPCCDTCNNPLNFVLQIYKKDFPYHYFPAGTNLFQLFRCPNSNCPDTYSSPYYADHKMFVHYFNDNNTENKYFIKPEINETVCESEIPDCRLKAKIN